MALPRDLAATQAGPIWNRPLQRFAFAQGCTFPVGHYVSPPFCRAGVHARPHRSDSKPGCSQCRRVRRDEGIPPTVAPGGRSSRSGWPGMKKLFVGGGIYCAAGAFRRPTAAQRRLLGRRSPRGTLRRREVPGTMQASSPTWGCVSRLAGRSPAVRRGGPWPSRGTLPRRRPGRYGIGPYNGHAMPRGFVTRLAANLPPKLNS